MQPPDSSQVAPGRSHRLLKALGIGTALAGALIISAPTAAVAAEPVEQLFLWKVSEEYPDSDFWGDHELTLHGDYSFGINRFASCSNTFETAPGAGGWAETTDPVVDADGSFTIALWARIDDLETDQTIATQPGFELGYSAENDRIQFSVPRVENEHAPQAVITALEPVGPNRLGLPSWYHVAVQVDLDDGKMRLFVDGVLQGETPAVLSPRPASGPLTIGASNQSGVAADPLIGAIDDVRAWSGAVDGQTIGELAADRPSFPANPSDAYCDDPDEPPVIFP